MQTRFVLTVLVSAVAIGGCGDAQNSNNNESIDDSTTSGPFWRLAETEVTPQVVGTGIEIDSSIVTLSQSEPTGWSITFDAGDDIEAFTTYLSDSDLGGVLGSVTSPDGSCEVTSDGPNVANLETTYLSPIPSGSGDISGECFGADQPGVTLRVVFGEAIVRETE